MFKKSIAFIMIFTMLFLLLSPFISASEFSSQGDLHNHDYIIYDYDTQTETVIPYEQIFNHSNLYQTTRAFMNANKISISKETLILDTKKSITDINLSREIINDNPRIATPPTTAPHSGVLFLEMGVDDDADSDNEIDYISRATGFLVAPDVLITCAHALVYTGTDRVIEMKIFLDTHGTSHENNYYVRPRTWAYSNGYLNESTRAQHDWCVIKLAEPVGGYNFNCSYENPIISTQVKISGYPGDKQFYQYTSTGNILSYWGNCIYYTNNTVSGDSGAPVYNPNTYTCYAIHRASANSLSNEGVHITQDMYNVICTMIDSP